MAAEDVLVHLSVDGKEIYSFAADPEEGFAIRYTHSVALTPVIDYFKIKDNAIVLDKTEYRDFGAGLPFNPENGQKMRMENGWIIMDGFNRKLGSFSLRVGRIAGHELLIPDIAGQSEATRKIVLSSLAPPGSAITFSVD